MKEGMTITTHNNTKGLVRAFDARTGKCSVDVQHHSAAGRVRQRHMGERLVGGQRQHRRVDADHGRRRLGLVYLPVESPSSDFYGGNRPGNNLFGESLVCVDLKTGQRKWHFQLVHHPIWDHDISSAPILLDVTIDGKPSKAGRAAEQAGVPLRVRSRHRQPIWPIVERRCRTGDVPGEWTSPTQPIPDQAAGVRPARPAGFPTSLIDFTPELRAQAVENMKRYKWGGTIRTAARCTTRRSSATSTDCSARSISGMPAAAPTGRAAAPIRRRASSTRRPNMSAFTPESVAPPPPGFSDIPYQAGVVGQPFRLRVAAGNRDATRTSGRRQARRRPRRRRRRRSQRGAQPARSFNAVEGLSMVKPPYGVLSAIDLRQGRAEVAGAARRHAGRVRNHPQLKGMNIPKTGQGGSVGVLVTKTLVIAGDPLVTTTPDHPRGAMMRAYNKQTGQEVGAVWMPAQVSGSPMTYRVGGKQYIVIAVSGGNYSGEYIAFALPASEISDTGGGTQQ